MRSLLFLSLGSTLFVPGAGRADAPYQIRRVVSVGDTIGDAQIAISGGLMVRSLNDQGHLVFSTGTGTDSLGTPLIQYADGKFTPIVLAGVAAPGGKWPQRGLTISIMSTMTSQGNVAFVAPITIAGKTNNGLFLWEDQTQQVKALALKGMPALPDSTFAEIGNFRTTINNGNEIAFAASLKTGSGKVLDWGVLLRDPEGQFVSVSLPGQTLPDGNQTLGSIFAAIDNGGRVAFLTVPKGKQWPATTALLWDKGALTVLAKAGDEAPGGGKFVHIDGVWPNHRNGSVLVSGILNSYSDSEARLGPRALYRFVDGQLLPVAVPGQPMPGGGIYKTRQWVAVSDANDLGQQAFFAEILEDGQSRTAAYLLDPDGKPSLILKSGVATDLGQITRLGQTGGFAPNLQRLGIGLNRQGQVALGVTIDNGPDTIVLLTPNSP
jgi:hypothetical protein